MIRYHFVPVIFLPPQVVCQIPPVTIMSALTVAPALSVARIFVVALGFARRLTWHDARRVVVAATATGGARSTVAISATSSRGMMLGRRKTLGRLRRR